jgi:ribosomal protein S18 acetylase RimI-like enzyme
MELRRATIDDLVAIVAEHRSFWGERDTSVLHHPMFVHEFGDTALVARAADGRLVGYLFGFVTIDGVGYIHLVAVREGHRHEGIGASLYDRFEQLARARGAVVLKAYTRPENTGSIAFHGALGFGATEIADYAGPGEARVVFRRELAPEG